MNTEKIYVQVDNDEIELVGQAKQDFINERTRINNEEETKKLAKEQAKEASALAKSALLEKLGITEDEARLLIS
jgi:hypothetical protein